MHFNSIKTATLGAFAMAVLGTTALSGTAEARPSKGYSSDWNWNSNGWGRPYGQMNSWNSDWNSYQPGYRRAARVREEHHSRKQVARRHHREMQAETYGPARMDERYPGTRANYAMQAEQGGRRSRSRRVNADPSFGAQAMTGGFGGGDLVSEARRYIGGNPTGRSSLWCGAFMDLILRRTGHRPGSNLARDYASYGTRVSGPQVGA